jgi:hypothetical protein
VFSQGFGRPEQVLRSALGFRPSFVFVFLFFLCLFSLLFVGLVIYVDFLFSLPRSTLACLHVWRLNNVT